MTNIISDLWAVPIPEDAYECYIIDPSKGKGQGLFWKSSKTQSPPWIDLPPGSWELIGISDEIGEGWSKIVQSHPEDGYFMDYSTGLFLFASATYSGISLLRSKGLSRCAIIRKNDY